MRILYTITSYLPAIGVGLVPDGDFVQCTAAAMPFRRESVDVLLSLGVLHHLPLWQASLDHVLDLLKPGGWMLFNEAVTKPRVLGTIRRQSLIAGIDSPHEGEIALCELLNILEQRGHLISKHATNTPLRVLLVWMLGYAIEHSLLLTKLTLGLDQVFLKTAGRAFKSFGAGEVLGIFERTSEH